MKVSFEFTLDDMADVAMRSTSRSQTLKSMRLNGRITLSVLIAGGAWLAGEWLDSGSNSLFVALCTGFLLFFLSGMDSGQSRADKLKKVFRERMGNGPFRCEVEIAENGLCSRQSGAETVHQWDAIRYVKDDGIDIEVGFTGLGLLVIRGRGFKGPEERLAFASEIRRRGGLA